jgi:hypothetical protein
MKLVMGKWGRSTPSSELIGEMELPSSKVIKLAAASSEFAISNGSACTANSYTPSHVLNAMGLTDDEIEESVRISWGHHGANRLPPDLPMFAKHLQLK